MATANLKDRIKNERTSPLVPKTNHPGSIKDLIRIMEPEVKKALPSVITPERFTRMALTAVSNTPALAECTQQSFLGALMNAAQLGLEPNTPLGQAYLIPFHNTRKGVKEVQFQIGYKGLIDLAHRSGEFKTVYAMEVYQNDTFHFEYGLDPKLEHVPATTNKGEIVYYYAVYTLVNGGFGFQVMSVEDVKSHAKRFSKSFTSGPWITNFDEMAKKTLIKKVLKYAPIKSDFARNLQEDQTVKTEIDADMSAVRAEIEAEYEVIDEETREVSAPDDSGTPFEDAQGQV